ncbi:MAG: hypothetical protein OEY85_02735, partial [Rhodospirillales bacterium]|nr:hypothetical protein [Rhodospirillales bacterium]
GPGAFKGVPTFKDLGYSADLGQMTRVLMAPRKIPVDRLNKLRAAMKELQNDKTYKNLIKIIGEQTNYIDGADYEALRPKQSAAFAKLVKSLAGK